jgi:mannose-6-phosphate isomerase-like protein (cupin superfamily)
MSYPEPKYFGSSGEASASLRRTDHEPELVNVSGVRGHYLATGRSTRGEFGLYRWEMPPEAGGPKPHFHRTITESFYILDGTVSVYDGRAWVDAEAGDFLTVPEGGIHGFRNESSAPASMLILFTPGAPREPYFETLSAVGRGLEMSEEEWQEFYRAHDTFWV